MSHPCCQDPVITVSSKPVCPPKILSIPSPRATESSRSTPGKAPLLWEDSRDKNLITAPDGLPRKGVVYYVEGIMHTQCGSPGVIITGLRSYWNNLDLPWCASRFRKVDALKGHVPKKSRRKQPVTATYPLSPATRIMPGSCKTRRVREIFRFRNI